MKTVQTSGKALTCLTLALAVVLKLSAAEGPEKPKRPAIYDVQADGAQQVAEALAAAKKENKVVLLQFGANWCGWCHKLHGLFHSNKEIADYLQANYVVALIDVDKVDNKPHNQATVERFGNPTTNGLPVIVLLDATGKQLVTQDTGKLEEGDHHDPAKVMAFLKKWGPAKK